MVRRDDDAPDAGLLQGVRRQLLEKVNEKDVVECEVTSAA
jgi:hypothetical protein